MSSGPHRLSAPTFRAHHERPDDDGRPAALLGRGLVKSYGGDVRALDGVDVTVATGEAVAVMGSSGSGKTTLLHCLAGILPVDAGEVVLQTPGAGAVHVERLGDAERSRLRREALGFVFQQGMLVPELTALENVALAAMLTGMPRRRAEQVAQPWLDALGLAGLGGRRIGALSGGQGQRVAIARALVTGPAVVFADEPTGALDSRTSQDVLDALLGATTGTGKALVVVTHDPEVAARCARTVHLVDGRVAGGARGVDPAHGLESGAGTSPTAASVGTWTR